MRLTQNEMDEIGENTRFFMRFIVFAVFVCLLLAASAVFAASYSMSDQAGNSVVLHETDCEQTGWLKTWKKASMKYRGKEYDACWIAMRGTVVVIDSAGDMTAIPIQQFTKMVEG